MKAEEFYDWGWLPENEGKCIELVRGEVVQWPRPDHRHAAVCALVGAILGNYTHNRRRGYTCLGSGFILQRNPDTVRGPDVSVYDDVRRYENLSDRYSEARPRLAVEILTHNDPLDLVSDKISDYLIHGVPLVWVIDPSAPTVTVHRPGKAAYSLGMEQTLTGDDCLPDFRCRVVEFFSLPWEVK
jgi:Uma2 family endonuclease